MKKLLILSILFIGLVSGVSADFKDVADQESVLYYDFEESFGTCSDGDTVSDNSGQGNTIDALTVNCVNTEVDGFIGEGFLFDDPDDQVYQDLADVSYGDSEYTWSFYVEEVSTGMQTQLINLENPDKQGAEGRPSIRLLQTDDDDPYINVQVRDALDEDGVFEAADGPTFTDEVHVVVEVTGNTGDEESEVDIYYDGVHVKHGTSMTSLAPDSNTEMSIGEPGDFFDEDREVVLDEIYAFDRHLTSQEIQDLASTNEPPEFESTSVSPDPPVIDTPTDVSFEVSDDNEVSEVEVEWFRDGTLQESQVNTYSSASVQDTITDFYTPTEQGEHTIYFTATDDEGDSTTETLEYNEIEEGFTLDVPDSTPIENEPYVNTEVPFSVSVIDGQLNNDYEFEFYNNGELVHDETVTKTSEGTIGPTESIEFSDYDEGKNTVNYTVTDLETGETETEERDYFGYNHETTIELSPPEGSILPPGDIETEANLETDWDYDLSITHSSGGVEDSVIDEEYSRTGPVDETFTLSQEFTDTTQSYFNELSVSFVVDEEDINTNTVDFTSEYNEFDIGEEAEVDIEWDWDYSTNDFSSNADSFWGPSTGSDGYEVLFGSAQTHEDGLVEGLDFRTATITIDNVPDSIDVQNPEFDLWLSDGEGNQFASPIYRGVDDSSEDLTLINETTNEADSFSRSAMISQLRESNFNDTFTVSDFQRTMEVGDGEDDPVVYTIPIPNEINRQHMGTNYSSPFDGTPESVSYELYMDMNEEWTEDYTGELVLNAEIEDEVYTGSIYFSNNIVFDNFRSSSSVSTKDTTLRFNVDKDISEFEQARVRVSQSVDDALRYDSEDEVGETIDVTNIANRPLIISRGDSPVTTWLEPLDSGDEIEVTVPPSYRGVSSDEFVSTLSTRTQLFERENISEEVEIDGSELDRGEFNAEFFFEDNMSRSGTQDGVEYGDSGNIDSFDRTFTIRENTIVGSFYQMFDNFLQWDDWVTGLLLFLVISLGGMLLIDLKLSFMLGLAYGLTVSIALLFTGILPLQINLLIVIMLGIIVTIIGRRIFS